MNESVKIPKECSWNVEVDWPFRCDPCHVVKFTVYAKTRSKARYQMWVYLAENEITECEYSETLKWDGVSIKKAGQPVLKELFQDKERFDAMKQSRSIDFAELGMKVNLKGTGEGYIIGSNSSLNLEVYFPEKDCVYNCHPWWQMTYFSESGESIKSFEEEENE